MKKLFCILLFTTFLSASEIDPYIPLTDVDRGLPTIAAGCVNVISGDYVESCTDLYIPGPIPLTFERFYSSGHYKSRSLYQGWHHNHDSQLETLLQETIDPLAPEPKEGDDPRKIKVEAQAYLIERSGQSGIYLPETSQSQEYNYSSNHALAKGMTNCHAGKISARANMKNNRIQRKTTTDYQLKSSNGNQAHFHYFDEKEDERKYRITEENFLNGHKLRYTYGDKDLASIVLTNHVGQTLGALHFNPQLKGNDEHSSCTLTSNDGRTVTYILEKYKNRTRYEKSRKESRYYHIKEVHSSDAPSIRYKYFKIPEYSDELVCQRSYPDNRDLWVTYERIGRGESYKVERIQLPVGPGGKRKTTHRFEYIKGKNAGKSLGRRLGGATEVIDANGGLTKYSYDESKRLCEVAKHIGDLAISRERFVWDDEGNLKCQRLDDDQGNTYVAKKYKYDKKGNVKYERIFGNISGKSGLIEHHHLCPKKESSEYYERRFKYTDDHLLKEEIEDSGRSTIYAYLFRTDLVKKKLILDNEQVKIREFYEYDDHSVLKKRIVDNGPSGHTQDLSNVTERRITTITSTHPTEENPIYPFGLPEVVEEKYIDFNTGEEKLLSRKKMHYTKEGRLSSQDVYDSNGSYCYSLTWEYDEKGNLKREANALNQEMLREYDANQNLIWEQGPNLKYHKEYAYDLVNRLVKEEIVMHDGSMSFVTTHEYDALGNRIKTIDYNQNETKFIYNELGQHIQTIFSPIPNADGELTPTSISNEYDIFGNVKKYQDQRGGLTKRKSNVFGKPLFISYPDGSKESFSYNLDGTLKCFVSKDNVITGYRYDALGRVIEEGEFANSQEKSFMKELLKALIWKGKKPLEQLTWKTYTYDSFHLLKSTDAEGVETRYSYDGAGRLIKEEKEETCTTYEYDPLGRLHKTKRMFGEEPEEYTVKVQEYDFLDRVIVERIEDALGNVLECKEFGYDLDGNCVMTKIGDSVTYTTYNSLGNPILVVDAEGNETHYAYEYGVYDDYGVRVSRITETDPLGIRTITTMNALNKPAKVIKKDSMDNIIAKQEMFYDGLGNMEQLIETVYPSERVVKTVWHYNKKGQLESIVEADEKTTRYCYNFLGQLKTIVKPDGKQIFHEYHPYLGFLTHFFASDESFDYTYEYNLNKLPERIFDLKNQAVTERKYDALNRMKQETLGNGITLKYAYDRMDRLKKITLPDLSQIEYVYDAAYLREVKRVSVSGDILYRQCYTDYDQAGRLLALQLPGKAGGVEFHYDLLGRVKKISHDKWSSELAYDAKGNLIDCLQNDIACEYTYDSLDQLTSEKGIAEHAYENDSLYNRLKQDNIVYTVNDLNQITSESGNAYEYDMNGNLIKYRDFLYEYDAQDRLTAVIKGNERFEYVYDAFNRRLSKERYCNDGLEEHFDYMYQDQNEIGCIDAGELIEFRVLGKGRGAEVGAAVALELKDKQYVPLHNQIGSIVCLLDLDGELVEKYDYSAFGEMEKKEVMTPWTFLSKRYDSETDFVYFGRRYYSPRLGRWMNPDPAWFVDGPNLYAYVKNNPLVRVDLFGLYDLENLSEVNDDPEMTLGTFLDSGGVRDCLYDNAASLQNLYTQVCDSCTLPQMDEGTIQALENQLSFSNIFQRNDTDTLTEKISEFMSLSGEEKLKKVKYLFSYYATEVCIMGPVIKGLNYVCRINTAKNVSKIGSEILEIEKIKSTETIRKNTGKMKNTLKSHPDAVGSHSSFKRDLYSSKIYGYESYDFNFNRSEWVPYLRFRGSGVTHHGVEPPLILCRKPGKKSGSIPTIARKPHTWELPDGY